MKEKYIPGIEKTSPNNTNPVIPVRQFVRSFLIREGKPRNFVNAVVGFTDGMFYTEQQVGDSNYHVVLALKTARKLGILDADLEKVHHKAESLYSIYQQFFYKEIKMTANDITTPEAVEIMKWKLELEKKRQEEENRRKKLKIRKDMKDRFVKIMAMSDTEISILNTNLHIDLKNDLVYRRSDKATQEAMRKRLLKTPLISLTPSFYEQKLRKISKSDDSILLNIKLITYIDRDELLYYAQYIRQDKYLRSEMGEEKFIKFTEYIFALLSGSSISASEVISWGLDSKAVLKKAKAIVSHYCVDRADRERTSHHRVVKSHKIFTKKGTDPHAFLGDGSGRKYLGYIQSLPKEKD